jgi:hypothetical protein
MLHNVIVGDGQGKIDPSPYERKELTKELSELLDKLT